jgi:hypothetical protein
VIGFLQPLLLFGLVAAAIPALLHLIGRRQPPVVVFPAVRYLTATEREHSRRLKLRNLLLLLLRTLVIVFIVLGAARPVARVAGGAVHPPTAVAFVIDNSLSSGAVVEGRRLLDLLAEQGRAALVRTTTQDRLWLVAVDGVPRRLSRAELAAALDSLRPVPVRLDLAHAVRTAAAVLAEDPMPGAEVLVFSDLQETALEATAEPDAAGDARVLVWEPPAAPANRGVDSAFAEPPRWSPAGAVVAAVGGTVSDPAAVLLTAGDRELARAVAVPGDRVVLPAVAPRLGWHRAAVELDPDELRADDRRWLAIQAAPPAAAQARPGAGSFVSEALEVLREGGRAVPGQEVVLDDQPAAGVTVLFPPADPSLVGALNRALRVRGVRWQLEALVQGEWPIEGALGLAAGTPIHRRYRLRAEGAGAVVGRAGGEPWLVRAADLVLVASRMEEEWTPLPVGAAFVPFVDFLINRLAARESWIVRGAPGEAVELPASAVALLTPLGGLSVPGDRRVTAPLEPGVYFLHGAGGDTVGALEVNHDPRESRLARAHGGAVRAALGGEARVLGGEAFFRELFRGTRRADLTGVMLLAAVLVAVAELALASAGSASRAEDDATAPG